MSFMDWISNQNSVQKAYRPDLYMTWYEPALANFVHHSCCIFWVNGCRCRLTKTRCVACDFNVERYLTTQLMELDEDVTCHLVFYLLHFNYTCFSFPWLSNPNQNILFLTHLTPYCKHALNLSRGTKRLECKMIIGVYSIMYKSNIIQLTHCMLNYFALQSSSSCSFCREDKISYTSLLLPAAGLQLWMVKSIWNLISLNMSLLCALKLCLVQLPLDSKSNDINFGADITHWAIPIEIYYYDLQLPHTGYVNTSHRVTCFTMESQHSQYLQLFPSPRTQLY